MLGEARRLRAPGDGARAVDRGDQERRSAPASAPIEHGIYLDDEAISLMRSSTARLVPTLVAPLGVREAAEAARRVRRRASWPRRQEVIEAHRDSVRRAAAAGVRWRWAPTAGVVAARRRTSRSCQLMADERHVAGGRARRDHADSPAELMGMRAASSARSSPGKRADLVAVAGRPVRLPRPRGAHRTRLPRRPARRGGRTRTVAASV